MQVVKKMSTPPSNPMSDYDFAEIPDQIPEPEPADEIINVNNKCGLLNWLVTWCFLNRTSLFSELIHLSDQFLVDLLWMMKS